MVEQNGKAKVLPEGRHLLMFSCAKSMQNIVNWIQ